MGKTASLANIGTIADSSLGFRNRIINGAMVIDQRNAGASVTPGSGSYVYTLDRWAAYRSTTSGEFSVQQSSTAPTGFSKSVLITVTTASTPSSGQEYGFRQAIEGFNFEDFGWGTASAQNATVSFWTRSSLTGTFGGAVFSNASADSYPFTFTISEANTWEYKTVTIPGRTSGTFSTGTGNGLNLWFSIGTGTTYTPNAWNTSGIGATGATNIIATSGATFYITGVQLEKGSTATSFDYRPYGTELALCMRYYWRFTNTTAGIVPVANLQAYNTTSAYGKFFDLPVVMRATPTANNGGSVQPTNSAGSPQTAFTGGNINATTASLYTGSYTGSTGLVAGNVTVVYLAVNGWFDASAEL